MQKIKKLLLIIFVFTGVAVYSSAQAASVKLYLFYGDGCPHCAKEEVFLEKIKTEKLADVEVVKFEVWKNKENANLLAQTAKTLSVNIAGVPFTVVGEKTIVGYADDESTGVEILSLIEEQKNNQDVVAKLQEGKKVTIVTDNLPATSTKSDNASTVLPFIGSQNLKKISLPLLTVIIGLLDSLNPCAMWVLLFLIGIILSMDDQRKKWMLGVVFIGASALAYFVFLSAWLNIYQFVRYVSYINFAIASVAILVGGLNLWDFWVNRNGGCDISGNPTKRKIIMDKIKQFALNKNFFVSLIGLAAVGAAVNMVELLCSAGLPAVYIPILTATAKSQFVYYVYLAAYCFFYVLVQIIVFLIAMFSLKQVAVGSRITRWFGLVSGILMIAVGIFLIFKPDIFRLFQ